MRIIKKEYFIQNSAQRKKVLFICPQNNSLLHFLPIADALASPAVDVALACKALPNDLDHFREGFPRLNLICEADFSSLHNLMGVDVAIAPEWNYEAPKRCKRIAFFHSLPDDKLEINYNKAFLRSRYLGAEIDYLMVALRQNPACWQVSNYSALIDKIWPTSALKHRQKSIGIIPTGYPKIDYVREITKKSAPKKQICFSPTSSAVSYSSVSSANEILCRLLEDFPEHQIIFRPYPSDRHRREGMSYIGAISNNPRFKFDLSDTGAGTLYDSELVVTDQSSSALTYAFGTGRGVVAYRPTDKCSGDDYTPVGKIATNLSELTSLLKKEQINRDSRLEIINKAGNDLFYSFGCSATASANFIYGILFDRPDSAILSIPRRDCGELSLEQKKRNLESFLSDDMHNKTVPGQVIKSVQKLAIAYDVSFSLE